MHREPFSLAPSGEEADDAAAPGQAVRALLAHIEGGDRGAAVALLAPDFAMRTESGAVLLSREGYADALAWDMAAGGERRIERFEVDGDTVTLRLLERTRFIELLGLSPAVMEVRYRVREGRIVEQRLRELKAAEDPSYGERFTRALAPVLDWARQEAPVLLERATDDGAVTYTGPSAQALVELVARYWTAHGNGP